jgi:hypothetical protein
MQASSYPPVLPSSPLHLSCPFCFKLFAELFLEADTDHSGYLDRQEFTRVLQSANLNLNERWVQAQAAEERDGNQCHNNTLSMHLQPGGATSKAPQHLGGAHAGSTAICTGSRV